MYNIYIYICIYVELVVESFGLHYLGPRAHQVCMYVCIYI